MDNLQTVLDEISQLTKTIETNYPELYQFLDENPMTIPSESNPTIDKKIMEDYLESLRQMLKHHRETSKIRNSTIIKKTKIMGEIATSNRQITLFHSSDSVRAKKTMAFAKAEGLAIQAIDILKTPLTGTQIVELANRLNLKVEGLINQEHPAYISKFEPHELSTEDWIKMIQHNPEIMKQPIALKGDHTVMVETPSDILKI